MSWITDTLTNIGGTIFGSVLGNHSAKANADISLDSWKYMQGNKHQLEVEDLRKAGLNPILSAGQGSAVSVPSVSGNPESQLGKNLVDAAHSAKQLKIAEKEADIRDKEATTRQMEAETNAKNAETLWLKTASDIDVNSALSAYHRAQESETLQNIKNALAKLPYEIDLLASNSEANRAAASLSLANIDLVASQKDLTDAKKKEIFADLNDPKKLASTEYWYNVFHSNDEKYKVVRASFYRGLENDVLFSFYGDSNKEFPLDAEKLVTILSRGKYVVK